ncbi:MAG TPA: septation protein A [Gammaproteobacteria bacterium]|nr:septation protein A [Gammaproteobacteria bacterium]
MIKLLLDFLPIALFFAAYKYFNLMVATQVAIAASLVQLIWLRISTGKIQKVNLISFLSILILGSATLLLKNDIFVKWKPTVVYWALAIGLFVSQIIGNKPFIQRLGETSVSLPDRIWRQLNISWTSFFAVLGLINLYVVYNFSTTIWVNFKLFGTLGLTIVFIVLQSIYMAKHSQLPNGNT